MPSSRLLKTRVGRKNDLEQVQLEFARALSHGDAGAASMSIDELLARRRTLSEIYTQVITPSLVSIGDLWCSKNLSVADEHLATQIVLDQLDRLRSVFVAPHRRFGFRVLIGCVEGERHWVGARMFADLCACEGWSVEFIGPDVPGDAFVDMVKARAPQVVALSATMTQGVEPARRVVSELSRIANSPRIILGGHSLSGQAKEFGDACVVAGDVVVGLECALEFFNGNRPKTVLKEYLVALGRRVRDLRLKKGWTQEQLAEGARVTRVCIVAVEGGKQNVSMDIVIRLANALGVLPEGLMGADAEPAQTMERTR
jgi:methanogenic corrinoid protein MtbC1/DNA-binding XRE family transcriptional regulator